MSQIINDDGRKLRLNQKSAVLMNYMKNRDGLRAFEFLESEGVEFLPGLNGLDVDKPILRVKFGEFGYEEVEGLPEIRTYVNSQSVED